MRGVSIDAPAETGGVRQLLDDVWRIVAPNPSPLTGPGTNTYVVGARRRVVIDPGPADPEHIDRILELTAGAIDSIVCTHSHEDHSPGAAALRSSTGAVVCGMPAPTTDEFQDPTYEPGRVVSDGDVVEAGRARLRILHTPGHASNHVCLLDEGRGLLYTGDHLMSGSTVVILPPDGSMRTYLESLRRLRELPIRELAPGHGPVMPGAIAEIDRVIAHRLMREARVIATLRAHGSATLDAMLPEVYSDVPAAMHPVARYSLLAHLIKLEEDARAAHAGETWSWRG